MRELLAELVDFGLLNPCGSPDGRVAELLGQYLRHETDFRRAQRFKSLLPAQAGPALTEVAKRMEEDRRRLEESSY